MTLNIANMQFNDIEHQIAIMQFYNPQKSSTKAQMMSSSVKYLMLRIDLPNQVMKQQYYMYFERQYHFSVHDIMVLFRIFSALYNNFSLDDPQIYLSTFPYIIRFKRDEVKRAQDPAIYAYSDSISNYTSYRTIPGCQSMASPPSASNAQQVLIPGTINENDGMYTSTDYIKYAYKILIEHCPSLQFVVSKDSINKMRKQVDQSLIQVQNYYGYLDELIHYPPKNNSEYLLSQIYQQEIQNSAYISAVLQGVQYRNSTDTTAHEYLSAINMKIQVAKDIKQIIKKEQAKQQGLKAYIKALYLKNMQLSIDREKLYQQLSYQRFILLGFKLGYCRGIQPQQGINTANSMEKSQFWEEAFYYSEPQQVAEPTTSDLDPASLYNTVTGPEY